MITKIHVGTKVSKTTCNYRRLKTGDLEEPLFVRSSPLLKGASRQRVHAVIPSNVKD